jgi:hypothetical protein
MRDRVLRLLISENYGCFLMQRSDGGELGRSKSNTDAVMGIEKNAAWGKKLSQPLGLVLIAWAGLIVGRHLA